MCGPAEDPADGEAPDPVRRSVVVPLPPAAAFTMFVDRFDGWWPSSHCMSLAPMQAMVLEPFVGGRCYEVDFDDGQFDYGSVTACESPTRLALAWRVGADWTDRPDVPTEIDVRFEAADGGTRVTFEHRRLERFGVEAAAAREFYESVHGWDRILDIYAEVLDELEEDDPLA